MSCMQRRPCDEGDLHIKYDFCTNGQRTLMYSWVDLDDDKNPDCDPKHSQSTLKSLPQDETVPCKQCTKGMQRDKHGNCSNCPWGQFQPLDLDDSVKDQVGCESCPTGTYA